MSALVVRVTQIDEIRDHPNADRLQLAIVGGWQVVVRAGEFSPGSVVIYFPPATVLPQEWTDRFGVTQYCSKVSYLDYPAHRIRCAKLRGEPSFGLVVPANDLFHDFMEVRRQQRAGTNGKHVFDDWLDAHGARVAFPTVGDDVADLFGATKYLPPLNQADGDAETPHELFVEYTEVENLRNFPDVLVPGEKVVATEKIHGSNVRIGVIEGEVMAGSHRVRRKAPAPEDMPRNRYWYPLTLAPVHDLLMALAEDHKQVILFGEVYGDSVQGSFDYGARRAYGFRAFDLLVDGHYVSWVDFQALCAVHCVDTAPVEYVGPYDPGAIKELAKGTAFAGTHIKEGIVIRPTEERTDPRVGRVILKYVSDDFLLKTVDSDSRDH